MPKRPFLNRASLVDIKQRINTLKSADLKKLSPGQLRSRIGRIIDDYPFQLRPLTLSGIYRARKNAPGGEFTKASELWWLPPGVGINPESVAAFVRHRLRKLATMPHSI